MQEPVKLTKTLVEGFALSPTKQLFIRDTQLTGFGLRVGKSTKTYFVEKRVHGKNVRKIIGNAEHMTPDDARKIAQSVLGMMAGGVNPVEAEREKRAKSETLEGAFAEYLKIRQLKPTTVTGMKYTMKQMFADWEKKPLNDITRDMVQKRHQRMKADNGAVHADNSMRTLRTIFNFAIAKYTKDGEESLIRHNPVQVLSATKAWSKKKRKQTIVEEQDMPAWFSAVLGLRNSDRTDMAEVARDYLLFALFSGLRRSEAARVKWSNVNLHSRKFVADNTKNGSDHAMPMSDFIVNLLTHRKSSANSVFVFPGEGASGHITEIKRHIKAVRAASDTTFTINDLRRNFITAAYQLMPYYSAKRLVNHSISQTDVSDGYNVITLEQLREGMQRIADYFLKAGNIDKETMTTYDTLLQMQKRA